MLVPLIFMVLWSVAMVVALIGEVGIQKLVGKVGYRRLVHVLDGPEVVTEWCQSRCARAQATGHLWPSIHHELLELVCWQAVPVFMVSARSRLLEAIYRALIALGDLELLVAVKAGAGAVLSLLILSRLSQGSISK